jgi:RND family efflux transporter MFP subunit
MPNSSNKPDAGRTKPAPPVTAGGIWRLLAKGIAPVLIVGVAVAAFVSLARTKPETKPRPVREHARVVETRPVEFQDHAPQLKLFGETVTGRKLELRALVAGEIISTSAKFREGGIVTKGAKLLTIDPFDFKQAMTEAQADLDEARAKLAEIKARISLERDRMVSSRSELKLAERDLVRAKRLFSQKLVSQKDVDDKSYTVSQRQQTLRQRQSNLAIEQARAKAQGAAIQRLQSKLARARRDLEDTIVVAPFDAYISAVNAEQGRMVSSNDRVATLIDIDRIDVRFNLSDAQFGRMISGGTRMIGRPLTVIWRIGKRELVYKAKIERVAAQISAATGGVEIFGRLDTPRIPVLLRPGAFVEVIIADATIEQAARLPETALYHGDRVFVVSDNKRLEARKVKLLGFTENDILVRGRLKPGDKVITTRLSRARTGLLVTIK